MRQEGMFLEFISFVNNPDGTPRYENTVQYAILKKEWDRQQSQQAVGGTIWAQHLFPSMWHR